jgi:hypothetical protein
MLRNCEVFNPADRAAENERGRIAIELLESRLGYPRDGGLPT